MIDLAARLAVAAVQRQACEELASVAEFFHCNPQLVPPSRIELLKLAHPFDDLARPPLQLVLREGASGALAQHPHELVAIVPPIAVEQPERAVEQQATKTGAIDRGASERKSGAA
ncbi:MAG TPA: hypothetical protein VFB02_28295 [Bradyrhizobium sp.]|nr:hypothetical protein [Bradyrhizobium sp.]